VDGHAGVLIIGNIGSQPVLFLQGRYHFYEGFSVQEITFPIRVLKILGIKKLLLTNSAGGISKILVPGDLMIIRDHINFIGTNPLIGSNDDKFGPRFPDCSNVYNSELIELASKIMLDMGLGVKKGVYIMTTGPNYETPTEVQMFEKMGADAVGSSTVPEAIIATQMGIQVLGIATITCYASGISEQILTHK